MSAPDDDPDDPGEWLGRSVGGRYRVDEVLGTGGMAHVFGAHDTELGRDVAVKVLRASVRVSDELRGRFAREARVLAALNHPHIVSLLDFGVGQSGTFLVMERLQGDTLGACLADEGPLPAERATHLLRQMLAALSYAHGEGLLHRDLKPDNVFLQTLGQIGDHVQLLDFGFAKFVAGEPDAEGRPLTRAGKIFGTPKYMAPEQLGGSSVDGRADVYAAGVLFFQMLSGRRPFEGELRDVLRRKIVEDPMPLSEALPDRVVPPELDAFLAKALATRRSDRFDDAAAMLAALDALPSPLLGAPPAPSTPRPRPRPPLLPVLLGAGTLVAAATLIAAGALLVAGDDPPPAEARPEGPPAEEPAPTPEPPPDFWRDAELAAPVAFVRDAVVAQQEVDTALVRDLRLHAREHPEDAHAQLLLGHLFAARGMQALASGAYQRALTADGDAHLDPRVLPDLLGMVAAGGHPGPGRLVREHWAEAAIPSLRRALANPGLDGPGRTRLQALLAELDADG